MKSIHSQVLSFIHSPDAGAFDSLALRVFRFQCESVPAYGKYCSQIGVNPDRVDSIAAIPMVSTVAFKYADLAPPAAAKKPDALSFLTSGTTIGRDRRGHHVIAHPEIYRASALAHLRSMMFPDGARMRMLAMHPTADRMPESSLSTMISWCIEEFGDGHALCAADRNGIDCSRAIEFLAEAESARAPVCILTTTAALGALFDQMTAYRRTIRIAPGSRVMDTGGAKGQAVPMTAVEVAERCHAMLAVEPDFVINEYGMTELCSQLYDATTFNSRFDAAPGARVKIAPPWMMPVAVDPATLHRVDDGTLGMLGFIDLANVCSVSAVLTEDLGIVEGNRVRVIGRSIAGGPRGCALAIAEFEKREAAKL